MSQLTITLSEAPFASFTPRGAMNVILAGSAFYNQIQVIFYAEGLWQLIREGNPEAYGYKAFTRMIPAFKWYDIEALYAVTDTLCLPWQQFEQAAYANNIQSITTAEAARLIHDSDACLNY